MAGTLHAFEYWLTNYRRVWYGSVFSSFVMPVLFMLSIGYGVGAYIDDTTALGGVSYAAFIAPGLLATAGLQTVSGEMSWPVYAALRWGQTYKAMQTSPLSTGNILGGHLLYGMMRALVTIVVFCGIMGLFGVYGTPWAPLAIFPALLAGFGLIGWLYAYSITVNSESALSVIQRFGVVPITLFSGVYFPLDELPVVLQPVAWISPLWHSTELSRAVVSGVATPWPWAVHLAYLLLLGTGGCWLAARCLRRRMTM